jgi:hypothetical protein
MKVLRRSGATLGLVLTILPSILYFAGVVPEVLLKNMMLAGSLLWFVAVIPKWDRT